MQTRGTPVPPTAIMSSPTSSQSDPLLWSARLEILLVVWRVGQAIMAFPPTPDGLTVRRWNAGIARELVRIYVCSCLAMAFVLHTLTISLFFASGLRFVPWVYVQLPKQSQTAVTTVVPTTARRW